MNTLKSSALGLAVAAAMVIGAAPAAEAGSLENMERERAILLETLLSGDLTPEERQSRVAISRARLVDLERIVLRDKSLIGRDTPMVRAAFKNYDLTFLVHASVEKGGSPADHWLSEIGMSTQTVMNARQGRR